MNGGRGVAGWDSELFEGAALRRIVVGVLAILVVALGAPTTATLAGDFGLPHARPGQLVVGSARIAIEGRWSDPATAYPPAAREQMPRGQSWWLAALAAALLLAAAAVAVWSRVDRLRARARLGRRSYDPRGSRPRGWARPRDVPELVGSGPRPNRFTVGRLDRRLVATDDQAQACVVAPPRTGKTTRLVIPWLLEHQGPAVVTSTRRDVLEHTLEHRAQAGPVWIWDPFSVDSMCWTPLAGCEDWDYALQQAQWLADAVDEGSNGGGDVARFWRGEAAKLLAPLLHAAALAGESMATVLRWVDAQTVDEPRAKLEASGAVAASIQLTGVGELDPRNRGTTYMSAGALLAAYRHPAVLRASKPGFAPEQLLDAAAATLYVVAPERHQRLLAPLNVAILSSLFAELAIRTNAGRRPEPTVRVLLDEAANIAPLARLPQHISEAGGNGARIATVWQSVAQMRARYAHDADTILAGSTAKVFMGPITDQATRQEVTGLLGDQLVDTESMTEGDGRRSRTLGRQWRPRGAPDALQQFGGDRGLFVNGPLPPAIVRLTPWDRLRHLRNKRGASRRAGGP